MLESRVATSSTALIESALVSDVMERLVDDHYLVFDGDALRFAFDLVRRAWIARA